MDMVVTDLGNAAKLALQGRLDHAGVDRIGTRFTASVVPSGRNALVDLSGVTFLSSIGVRMLIGVARALKLKDARMVLFGAQPLVKESLEHVSIGALIPLVVDEAAAVAALTS